ncbi:MAG: hypothetical protein K0S86_4441 [Geminicoccaceae bacterium]|nr:hypothetical protein [Geminicoccaceae bacterium]
MSSAARPYNESSVTSPARARATVAWLAVGVTVAVTALAVAFAWLVYVRIIRADLPLSYDEGAHALFGLTIANDLRSGDALALAYDIYRQVYWPPLHSVLVGAAFVTSGDRIAVARGVSLVAYALIPLALLAAGRAMWPRDEPVRGWVAGGVAGILAVATPALVPFASLAFLELPALLAVALTLLAYFVAERAVDRPRRRALIAAGVVLAYFLKTNYGILLIVVLALDALCEARFSIRALFSRRNAYVVVPLAAVFAVWFAYPPKIAATIRAMVNKPAGGVNPWTLEGLLFYPGSLLDFAGSPAMLVVLLAGVVGAWGLRRMPNVRLLLLLAGVQFLLGEVHHTKNNRHIFPLVPALFLLTGAAAARLLHGALGTASQRARRVATIVAAAFVVLAAVQMWRLAAGPLPTAWARMPGPPDPSHGAIIDAAASAVARGERVLLVGTFDLRPGPPVLDWDLAATHRLLTAEHAGAVAVVDANRQLASALGRAPLPSWVVDRMRRVLQRSDAPARLRTTYAGLPQPPVDSITFAASFHETLRLGRVDRVIVATAASARPRFPRTYLEPALAHPALVAESSRIVGDQFPVRLEEYRVLSDTTGPARLTKGTRGEGERRCQSSVQSHGVISRECSSIQLSLADTHD